MKLLKPILFGGLVAGVFAVSGQAAVIYSDAADGTVNSAGVGNITNFKAEAGRLGDTAATVLPFLLPTLPVGEVFDSADLQVTLFLNNAVTGQNADLYGLSRISASSAITAGDFYIGTLDASATLIQNDFLTPATPSGSGLLNTSVTGDAALLAFLNAHYAGGTNAGQYVFLRFSSDILPAADNRYEVRMSEADGTGLTRDPQITYTSAIPEPGTLAMLSLGGLAMLVRRRATA